MTAFFELTPQFKKLKRSASLEFCVHLDMSQIGIVCFTKRCLGYSKFRMPKSKMLLLLSARLKPKRLAKKALKR